jgi:phytoene dehydrogenase-like protein
LVLTVAAHVGGWPMVRGGAQQLSNALEQHFRSLGGVIETNAPVATIDELAGARAVLCDVSPRQLISIAGHKLPEGYCNRLRRYQYGPGVWKVDWALDGPIPWNAPACADAGTVHLGGTFDEIAMAERAPWNGQHADRPFVLLGQPTLFDPSRAPSGKHTAWAYCHVPNGSTVDMTDRIEAQVERFAKGFRDRILARHVMSPADFQTYNANLIGGDITGGANLFSQVFARPVLRHDPYSTPLKGLYLCSASTPPGGGVHGMCGYWAARSALRKSLA